MSNGDWSIKPTERIKYDQLFDSLQPANGYIPGNKVKGVLMDSKLPVDTLGKIWDLADMDKDGMLDRHEFVVVSIFFFSLRKLISEWNYGKLIAFYFIIIDRRCTWFTKRWRSTRYPVFYHRN